MNHFNMIHIYIINCINLYIFFYIYIFLRTIFIYILSRELFGRLPIKALTALEGRWPHVSLFLTLWFSLATSAGICFLRVVVRWQQDKNGKEAREGKEGKSGRISHNKLEQTSHNIQKFFRDLMVEWEKN